MNDIAQGYIRRMTTVGVAAAVTWVVVGNLIESETLFTTYIVGELAFGTVLGLVTGAICGFVSAWMTRWWFNTVDDQDFYRVLILLVPMFTAFIVVFPTMWLFPFYDTSREMNLLNGGMAALVAGRAGRYYGQWWYLPLHRQIQNANDE